MVEVASKLQVYHLLLFHMEEYQFEGWILSVSDAKQCEWYFHLSIEIRLTKAELLQWNHLQYEKLLCHQVRKSYHNFHVEHHQLSHICWDKPSLETNFVLGRMPLAYDTGQSIFNYWYMTWGVTWGLLCTTTAAASRIRAILVCSVFIAHNAVWSFRRMRIN